MFRPPFSAVVVIAGLSTVWASTPAGAAPLATPEISRASTKATLAEMVGWRRRQYWRHGYPVPYVYYPPAYGYYPPPPAYAAPRAYGDYPPPPAYASPPAYGNYPPPRAAGGYGNYPPPPTDGEYGNYPPPPADDEYGGDYPAENGY